MKTVGSHTALPWHACNPDGCFPHVHLGENTCINKRYYHPSGFPDDYKAECRSSSLVVNDNESLEPYSRTMEVHIANAEFIVLACNSFYPMREALVAARRVLFQYGTKEAKQAYEMADAALRSAGFMEEI